MKLYLLLISSAVALTACGGNSGDSRPDRVIADAIEAGSVALDDISTESTADTNQSASADGSDDSVFSLADTSWQSECTVEGATPGFSQIAVWTFTASHYSIGPYLYDNVSCQGEPLSDVLVDGRYELTGNVTTATDGRTVYEFIQYVGVQQIELPLQTIWLYIEDDGLFVAVNTDQGVVFDGNTPVLYRQ